MRVLSGRKGARQVPRPEHARGREARAPPAAAPAARPSDDPPAADAQIEVAQEAGLRRIVRLLAPAAAALDTREERAQGRLPRGERVLERARAALRLLEEASEVRPQRLHGALGGPPLGARPPEQVGKRAQRREL